MWRHIGPAIRMMIVFTILTGLIYPAVITGLCQLFFPKQANGSLISAGGQVIGSSLIGQNFAGPEYFHPRPSAAGSGGYDPMQSGGSNLGPTSKALYVRIRGAVKKFHRENPAYKEPVPVEMVTTSGSGLDPDISPASAFAQARRVAKARGATLGAIRQIIRRYIQPRQLGFLGEPRIDVLAINLALDRDFPRR